MINLLPIDVRLLLGDALLLQVFVDLVPVKVELGQLPPHALLGHQRRHEIPGGRRRLQVTIVSQAKNYLANALLSEKKQTKFDSATTAIA